MIPSVFILWRPPNVDSFKKTFYKGSKLSIPSCSLFVVVHCTWVLFFGFPCLILNAADASIGDLVGCLVTSQNPVLSILTAFFPGNMLYNASICIKDYKYRLLLEILYLSFWARCPLANRAPINLFPLGFSADPPYVWFFFFNSTIFIIIITYLTSTFSWKMTLGLIVLESTLVSMPCFSLLTHLLSFFFVCPWSHRIFFDSLTLLFICLGRLKYIRYCVSSLF